MLADLIRDDISAAIRLRGKEYFNEKRVHVLKWHDDFAVFQVRGTQTYTVKLELDFAERQLFATCTCPYFANELVCKHIWGAVLRADGMNIFSETNLINHLSLILKPKPTNPDQPAKPETPDWRRRIQAALSAKTPSAAINPRQRSKSLFLAIELERSAARDGLIVHLMVQETLKNNLLSTIKTRPVSYEDIATFSDLRDQDILRAILGHGRPSSDEYTGNRGTNSVLLEGPTTHSMLLDMATRKRLLFTSRGHHSDYDYKDEIWQLRLTISPDADPAQKRFHLSAEIKCGSQIKTLNQISAQSGEFIFFKEYLARADFLSTNAWAQLFATTEKLALPHLDIDEFLEMYFSAPNAPEILLPTELQFDEETLSSPQMTVIIDQVEVLTHVSMRLEFSYGSRRVAASDQRPAFYDLKARKKSFRDFDFESQAKETFSRYYTEEREFNEETLIQTIEAFIALGWEVLAAQRPLQTVSVSKVEVTSGIDWFGVDVQMTAKNQQILLPQLLRQLTERRRLMVLDDGSVGILPIEWMQKVAALSELGEIHGGEIRLNKIQTLFISEIFADSKQFKADKKFNALKDLITELNDLEPQSPDRAFKGELRPYQQIGLGWLSALTKNGIGGILADDMGLGKTVQVLATLSKNLKNQKSPALIVAPKSLVFNWVKEAEKFCPHFKVLNYSGSQRDKLQARFKDHDLVVMTYQTLRNDIEKLREFEFSYFILDEAHSVKNSATQNAIACTLIKAPVKFALTGTPVENSITDLFSIFSIINPGLITKSMLARWGQERDPEKLKTLTRAFKPFLLRRTKEQVLPDLPEKSEQILYCELSADEQKHYDELKQYYWQRVSGQIENKGLARSKFEILEGLLRLRQAACHRGLLNAEFKNTASTKFEILLDQIDTVIRDGHKALIFSQFTSLLGLLQTQLAARGISFEYLDGKTKDRQERVERFQQSQDISLFLLSLKAGGVGLNLTAADYVFILDPWWNPAAEMQAIDRAHRIGQNKKVFAYKIIAKNTVEEKILELQATKKKIAQAVIGDETSILKGLSLNDLKDIFS